MSKINWELMERLHKTVSEHTDRFYMGAWHQDRDMMFDAEEDAELREAIRISANKLLEEGYFAAEEFRDNHILAAIHNAGIAPTTPLPKEDWGENECGSSACLAGWVCSIEPNPLLVSLSNGTKVLVPSVRYHALGTSIHRQARELLGLDSAEAIWLFETFIGGLRLDDSEMMTAHSGGHMLKRPDEFDSHDAWALDYLAKCVAAKRMVPPWEAYADCIVVREELPVAAGHSDHIVEIG